MRTNEVQSRSRLLSEGLKSGVGEYVVPSVF